ncbi:MAG: hypothetical protein AABW59_01605 [archaeon]
MQNVSFLREVFLNAEENVSLVVLNQQQTESALDFTIKRILIEEGVSLIYVSLTKTAEEVLQWVPQLKKKNIFIIDAFSSKSERFFKEDLIEYVDTPSNLTGIQIGIEEGFSVLPGKKVVIIDSLGALSSYNDKKTFGKFIYTFSNKIKLSDNTMFLFSAKDSLDVWGLSLAKQFCDKIYDFSGLYVTNIEVSKKSH